jgi:hypothetical protein
MLIWGFDAMLDINLIHMIHEYIFLPKLICFLGCCSCFGICWDKIFGLKCIWAVTDLFELACNVVWAEMSMGCH